MPNTNQKVFLIFAMGLFIFSTSILLMNTSYFIYLLMAGIWMMISSGILYKMYVVRKQTPKTSLAQREQFVSNIKLLIS